jgi:cyanophycin synthetase
MVGRDIIDNLFAEDQSGRIPIVGIAGSRGKTMVARLTARMIGLQGTYVGLACSEGFYLKNRRVEQGDCANWDSGQRLLINRSIQAAVIENSHRAILSEGLAYDRCQVGVLTNIDPQATLPEFFIDTAEQMANVMRTQVDVVLPGGAAVLNAADARVAEMAALCDGETIFFSVAADLPVVAAHREQGGRAVFLRDGRIVLASGAMETAVIDIAGVPWVADKPAWIAENILAAVGAAWALDVPIDLIRTGIEFFDVEGEPAVG